MEANNYFDDVAENWDRLRTNFFSEQVREKAIGLASLKTGQRVADIGAGSGFITEGLLEKGAHVTVVEPSLQMLKVIQYKFDKTYGEYLNYVQGDIENVVLPEDHFDFVFANMVLHHTVNPIQAIKIMTKIVKPGGKVIITDLDKHDYTFLKEEHHDRWLGFERQDIKDWYEAASLENVTIACLGEKCSAPSSCGSEYANITMFIASGEKK
ncbi:class I SAM-dependent methyltransferase [Bacillus alkalicellulosilyticus]|uniref:class I SAM-dependent methyltransferase n=1 Tax=Alkalihalobacterium alkalicellulosilyticum TaxID=1912214 RepID=UPI000996A17B|nr:methyltransferase domain-containing protein [Bacillus alkalicellulosilyticus]